MYSDAVLSHNSSVVVESIFADKPVFLLELNPREVIHPHIWIDMTVEEYFEKMNLVRKYDLKNLFLFSAVCYLGWEQVMPKEEYTLENQAKSTMLKFVEDIRNGIDSKKELRGIFREQSFVNLDGTCGQKIHDYIVKQITA